MSDGTTVSSSYLEAANRVNSNKGPEARSDTLTIYPDSVGTGTDKLYATVQAAYDKLITVFGTPSASFRPILIIAPGDYGTETLTRSNQYIIVEYTDKNTTFGITDGLYTVTADDSQTVLNMIQSGMDEVIVDGVTNDANDFIVLPTPIQGKDITIYAEASSNFEIRTLSASGVTINGVDSDGTQEYLATDTDVIKMFCSVDGYIGHSEAADGTRTDVTPD